jgi:hypothetical protein
MISSFVYSFLRASALSLSKLRPSASNLSRICSCSESFGALALSSFLEWMPASPPALKSRVFFFLFHAANLLGLSRLHRHVKSSTTPHRRLPHCYFRFPHHFALHGFYSWHLRALLVQHVPTLVALSRFLALCPATLFVVIACGLDIREHLISFPKNISSVPLANERGRSALRKFARRSLYLSLQRLSFVLQGSALRSFKARATYSNFSVTLPRSAHMSIVQDNLLKQSDVFRIPKLSASTAVLWSDIFIKHVRLGKKVPGAGVAVRACVCDLQDAVTRSFVVASIHVTDWGRNVIYPLFLPTQV